MEYGTTFSVGTGFSDAEREAPPPVGSFITFRYQELTEAGLPRFPSFVGVRAESPVSPPSPKGDRAVSKSRESTRPGGKRRFEFSEGNSNKFWEVCVQGTEVTVHYGRIGSEGQTKTKSFPDEEAAADHAKKLIGEKTDKGYREV